MPKRIDYDFESISLEWHMYRNQEMTLEELRQEIDEALDEADALEKEHGDILAKGVDTDDVQSPILLDELLECDDSSLDYVVACFAEAFQALGWMLEEFYGNTKCSAFVFGKWITTDEQRVKMTTVD